MSSIPPEGRGADSALDPSAEQIRDMGTRAVEWVAAYHESIRELPIAPRTSVAGHGREDRPRSES